MQCTSTHIGKILMPIKIKKLNHIKKMFGNNLEGSVKLIVFAVMWVRQDDELGCRWRRETD